MSDQDQDRPIVRLPVELPSPPSIFSEVPRGGVVDQLAEVASAAAEVPALGEVSAEREAYRQTLIAGNRALDGDTTNGAVRGTLIGLGVVAVGFVVGPGAALVVGAVYVASRLVSFFRGRP